MTPSVRPAHTASSRYDMRIVALDRRGGLEVVIELARLTRSAAKIAAEAAARGATVPVLLETAYAPTSVLRTPNLDGQQHG